MGIRIVLVDDHEVFRIGLRTVIGTQDDMRVVAEAGSGEEALEILCRDYPQIPVIIITGHGTVDKAVECMKKGAYDFITKPFQIDQFLLAVERAGEKRRLELKARQYEKENIRNLYDLHLEKSRLRTIMNFMANGVMVTNRNMEVVLHNAALMQLMGLTERKKNPFPVSEILQDQELIETIPFLKYDRIIPGADRSLKHLAEKHQLILVTLRNSRGALDWELEYMDIRRYFREVLSTNSVNVHDYSRLKASLIESTFNALDPAEIIVGDTETDILTGQELGIRTVAVLSGMRTESVLQEVGPTFVLKDLMQVAKAIDEGVM